MNSPRLRHGRCRADYRFLAVAQKERCEASCHAERSEESPPGRFAALSVTALHMRSCHHRLPWERGRPARMQARCLRSLIRQQHPSVASDVASALLVNSRKSPRELRSSPRELRSSPRELRSSPRKLRSSPRDQRSLQTCQVRAREELRGCNSVRCAHLTGLRTAVLRPYPPKKIAIPNSLPHPEHRTQDSGSRIRA